MKKYLLIACLQFSIFSFAQQIKVLNLDKAQVNLRGLSVLDDYIFWVSGSKGTIGFSLNGGKTMNWVDPADYADRDFRDIEVLDYKTAVAVAVGEPALIIKTTDSGKTWNVVYTDDTKGVFLDDIDFSPNNPNLGIVVGDPIDGKPYILSTSDAGSSWAKLEEDNLPQFAQGEAFFAASGSNSYAFDHKSYMAVTGGSTSSLMITTAPPTKLNLTKTSSSTAGANGMDYHPITQWAIIVGGDFQTPESSENNLFNVDLKNLKAPILKTATTPPSGYKSGVAILDGKTAIACGLTGTDYTQDKGDNWRSIGTTPYNSCKRATKGKKVYLVGPNGRIGHLTEN